MTISVDQRFALLAKLGENLNWDSLTVDQIQVGIREAHNFAAREFEALIRNGFRFQIVDFFRETGEIAIQIPALARPTLDELKGKYYWIKRIERDTSPIEAVTLRLGTVLRTDEEWINGAEYERRLNLYSVLGYQHAEWLVRHQEAFLAFAALRGVHIDFPGLIVLNPDGRRNFPCLLRGGERWGLSWGWFGLGSRRDSRIAVSGK